MNVHATSVKVETGRGYEKSGVGGGGKNVTRFVCIHLQT